jgi:hypothetical protein
VGLHAAPDHAQEGGPLRVPLVPLQLVQLGLDAAEEGAVVQEAVLQVAHVELGFLLQVPKVARQEGPREEVGYGENYIVG